MQERAKWEAAQRRRLGTWAEDRAEELLLSKEYIVLARNWQYKNFEVDLIARDGNMLVIVEVKARKSAAGVVPERAINARKKNALVQAARQFMQANNWKGECRFDVIAVTVTGSEHEMEHFEDAFYPVWFTNDCE